MRFLVGLVFLFALSAHAQTPMGGVTGPSGGSTPLNCTPVQTGSGTDSGDNNQVIGVNCTIASSMTVTACTIAITTTASGNGVCGIYATSTGTPTGNPLATSGTTALASPTTTASISASLTAGTYYIGWNFSSASTVIGTHPTGCSSGARWATTTGTTFPNMAMSGASWNDTSVCLNVSLTGTTP